MIIHAGQQRVGTPQMKHHRELMQIDGRLMMHTV